MLDKVQNIKLFKQITLLLLILVHQSLQQVQYDIIVGDCTSEGWTQNHQYGCWSGDCVTASEYVNNKDSLMQKTFLLNPHYKVGLKGRFYIVDNVSPPTNLPSIYFDNQLLQAQYLLLTTVTVTSSCTFFAVIENLLEQQIYHSYNSLTISISSSNVYWAIQKLQLVVYYCNPGCQFCGISGECLYLQKFQDLNEQSFSAIEGWYKNGFSYTDLYQKFLGGDVQIFGFEYNGSVGNMFEKQILLMHQGQLTVSFNVIFSGLWDFQIQILINQIQVQESSYDDIIYPDCNFESFTMKQFQVSYFNEKDQIFIGIQQYNQGTMCSTNLFGIRDLVILYDEKDCQDQNQIPFDGCHQNMYSCIEGCKECLKGHCYECIDGFEYIQSSKVCLPICGDEIIQLNEECDDGNEFPYDGCFNCKFSCSLDCLKCEFGFCSLHRISPQPENHDLIINILEFGFTQHLILNDEKYKYIAQLKSIECQNYDYTIIGFYYSSCEIYQIPWCKVNQFKTCFECVEGYELDFNKQLCQAKCNDGYLEEFEQCDDDNNIQFDGCYKCQNNCQIECLVCQKQKCIKCTDGWNLDNDSCYQKCGDGVISYGSYKQCDDGNDVPGDGCYQCKIECSSNCKLCTSSEICQICEDHFVVKNNYCYPICGDKIIVEGLEECDDGNNIEYDGCYNCQFSCPYICSVCEQGTCLQLCDYGYYFVDQQCFSKCGDKIVASNEDCDDGNDIEFDGCYNCLNSCSQACSLCEQGMCLQFCDYGYYFIDQQCTSKCGDKIVASNEECDDGNDIEFDGCYNCQFSCPYICSVCEQGTCLQLCDYGYYFVDQQCTSKCGDKIVASNEECDDGNDIEFDGCYNCLSSCSSHCLDCLNGKCFKCAEGYQFENYQCLDICGNGNRDAIEECDDGNNVNGDGCSSNCIIENDFFCQTLLDSQSECLQNPLLQLTYLSKNQENQYIQLSFTKQLKILSQNLTFVELLQYSIGNLDSYYYNLEITPINELSLNQFTSGKYKIKIQFLQSNLESETLSISFKNQLQLIDQDALLFDQTKHYSMSLQPCFLMEESQIRKANQFKSISQYMIIGIGVSSSLILLSGDFNYFLELLDVLQYQSYLRYLNLDYPQNLYIYFQSSDSVTLQPILEFFNLNDFFSFMIGKEYLESIYQFKQYGINADLLTNIHIELLQIVLALAIILLTSFYKRLIVKNCFTFKYCQLKSRILNKLTLLVYKLHKRVFMIKTSISSENIKQIFLVNSWDLTFNVLIFIISNQKQGIREQVSYIFCSLYISYVVFYFITYYQRKLNKNTIIDRHQMVILIKRLSFLLVLISLQSAPTKQCILQICVSVLYIGLVITTKLTESKLETQMILISEIPILVFIITALPYSPDFIKKISDEKKVTLGFAQISILTIRLFAPLFKQAYAVYLKLHNYYQKKILEKEKKNENPKEISLFGVRMTELIHPQQ